MSITPERAKQLRDRGFKVDFRQIARPARETPAAEVSKPVEPQQPDHLPAILGVMAGVQQASESNTAAVAKILQEMKRKRSWRCTIGRNGQGDMSTVDIEER